MTIINTSQTVDGEKYSKNYDGINWKSKRKSVEPAGQLCPVCCKELSNGICTMCGWKK